ncbi:hypothetical protein [Streptomyces sp. NPDC047079]|uniref:hypothetical protein n=1 Tax=Streptomyces sp. NPDC047079 TaxID=3154607 RepID=UPI0033F83B8C
MISSIHSCAASSMRVLICAVRAPVSNASPSAWGSRVSTGGATDQRSARRSTSMKPRAAALRVHSQSAYSFSSRPHA